tara:strand:+ start:1144 stop:4155 length:3012 start_codon:yes stop_codon:yes gene_type:complete
MNTKLFLSIISVFSLISFLEGDDLCSPDDLRASSLDGQIRLDWKKIDSGINYNTLFFECFPTCNVPSQATIIHEIDNGTGGWYRDNEGGHVCAFGAPCDTNSLVQFGAWGGWSAEGDAIDSRMNFGPFTIPIDSTVYLNFVEAYIDWAWQNNSNSIEISTDNGVTWQTVFVSDANQVRSEFLEATVDLSAYAGQSILVSYRYVCEAGFREAWIVDQIGIYYAEYPMNGISHFTSINDTNFDLLNLMINSKENNGQMETNGRIASSAKKLSFSRPIDSEIIRGRKGTFSDEHRNTDLHLSRDCGDSQSKLNIYCSAGDYPSEVSWSIYDSSGVLALSGIAPDSADTCFNNGYYTIIGYDSYGDGWDNAYFTITNSDGDTVLNYTFYNGHIDTATFYVGPLYGCTDPYADNYNPFANIDDGSCTYTTCQLNQTYFYCSEGYWAEEVGWYVEDSLGTVVASGVADNNEVVISCIDNGSYKVVGTDTYGDGWNGAWLTVSDSSGNVLLGWTLENGFIDSTYFYAGPIYGCTDPEADNYNHQATVNDGSCIYLNCYDNKGYIIYLDGDSIDFTYLNTYTLAGVENGKEYCLSVASLYAEGISDTSTVCVTPWNNVVFSPLELSFDSSLPVAYQEQELSVGIVPSYDSSSIFRFSSGNMPLFTPDQSLFFADFNSGLTNMYDPSGLFGGLWQSGNAESANSGWFDYGFSMDSSNFAWINDDQIGAAGGAENAYLITEEINILPGENVLVAFDLMFPQPCGSCANGNEWCGGVEGEGYSEDLLFMLSTTFGETWVKIDTTMGTGTWDWNSRMYNITEEINGATSFILAFFYNDCNGNWAYGVGIDNFALSIGGDNDWLIISPYSGVLDPGNIVNTTVRVYTENNDNINDSIQLTVADETLNIPILISPNLSIEENNVPIEYSLGQNYPNPFNPITIIPFDIAVNEKVQLLIYNILGKQVASLVNGNLNAGRHTVTWNGKSDSGIMMPTGLYIYEIRTDKFRDTGKMLFIK